MKNGEIMATMPKLAEMRKRCSSVFPANIAYKITRNFHTLLHLEVAINEVRDQIIASNYEPVVGELGTFRPRAGLEQLAIEEMNKLYDIDNEVNIQTFKFSEISHMHLSLEDMDAIYFMIEED